MAAQVKQEGKILERNFVLPTETVVCSFLNESSVSPEPINLIECFHYLHVSIIVVKRFFSTCMNEDTPIRTPQGPLLRIENEE